MAQIMPPFGGVVQMDWHSTAEGETVLQNFYNPQTSGRKLFGILERPLVPLAMEEVSYKLFFAGKAGVGKTSCVARLAGSVSSPASPIPASYVETTGIRKTNIFWPVKIWDKAILFKLQCWDAGETTIKKYSHILPSCREKADAIVLVFSFVDEHSFAELPQLMLKLAKEEATAPATIVIGTRFSLTSKMEVSTMEVKEFEQKWRTTVLRMNRTGLQGTSSDRNEVHKMAPILNSICERLWIRDQEYLLRNGMTV